jgi:hypothetical protein
MAVEMFLGPDHMARRRGDAEEGVATKNTKRHKKAADKSHG